MKQKKYTKTLTVCVFAHVGLYTIFSFLLIHFKTSKRNIHYLYNNNYSKTTQN